VGSSFKADPQALHTASTQFAAQANPINTAASEVENLHGSGSNTGRFYSGCGTAYHAAMLTFIQTLLTPMASKTSWVADTLSSTATNYEQRDQTADAGLQSAGKGA
jgi:hypothetical protein